MKGQPSVKLAVNGNGRKQTLNAEILADKDNYFTPVNIDLLRDKVTALRSTIDFKGDRIKIKDTGIFTKNIVVDDKGNEKPVYKRGSWR